MKPKKTGKREAARTIAVRKPGAKGTPRIGGGKQAAPGGGAREVWRRLAALPQWMQAVGGAAVLVVIILLIVVASGRREAPAPGPAAVAKGGPGTIAAAPAPSPAGEGDDEASRPLPAPAPAGESATEPSRQEGAPAAATPVTAPEQDLAFIKAVRLRPLQPTRLDTLKAQVAAAPGAPGGIRYTYLWRVNDRIVEEAKGDSLALAPFKMRDLVAVSVTPYDGETAGFAVDSPVVAIHSVPPTIDLQEMRRAGKIGEPIELQLVGTAPEGERLMFSLEEPRVPGMTLDQQSGKITWLIPPDQKGTIRFGAAVQDDNGTKVTRIFALTVN